MKKILVFCACVLLVVLSSTNSFGQYRWGGRHGHYNRGYNYHAYSYFPNFYHPYAYRPYYRPYRSSLSIITSLPFGALGLHFGNRYYRYYDGMYYQPFYDGYERVEPPVGAVVPNLPAGATAIVIGGTTYYTYRNVYYAPLANRNYQVINQPDETTTSTVTDPPSAPYTEYKKIIIDGKTYYQKGDIYYKATIDDKGEISYKAVGQTSK